LYVAGAGMPPKSGGMMANILGGKMEQGE
jgi:hypothetical protein